MQLILPSCPCATTLSSGLNMSKEVRNGLHGTYRTSVEAKMGAEVGAPTLPCLQSLQR